MSKIGKFTFLLMLLGQSISGQVNPNPSPALDALIQEEMQLEQFPGVATVIVKNGKIVWLKTYGWADVTNSVPVNQNTVFLLASVSKLFTGTAAMQLVDENVISLDDDIAQHLPFPFEIPAAPAQTVTFRHLMTHTSSAYDNYDVMEGYYDFPDPTISLGDCMFRYFSPDGEDYDPIGNFLSQSPGTAFEYSNMATALNGYLVELISEQPFNEFCHENIFEPLCMENTGWFFSDFEPNQVALPHQYVNGTYEPYPHFGFADYPDGQLRSTVLDLANFMIAMLNNGTFGDQSILSSSAVNQMLTVQFPPLEDTQGLNWYKEELYHSNGTTWLWGHNGGEMGTSTVLYIDPVNKIGLCVLTNGEGDPIYICDGLYDYALSMLPNPGFPPPCLPVGVDEVLEKQPAGNLIKIIDFLGREIEPRAGVLHIRIYDDGHVEKVIAE
jgi:CubicO group peptidase (beta-lactamase class C family)